MVVPKTEVEKGGIRLVIFHSTHASAHAAARVLLHTTAPVRSTFCLQGKRVKMHAICVRLRDGFTAQSFVLFSLCWTAVHLFSFHNHVNRMPHM